MLLKNPPTINQRYMAFISPEASLAIKWREKLAVASSPWGADLAPVTSMNLKQSLLNMRNSEKLWQNNQENKNSIK